MSLCINPNCQNTDNPDNLLRCQSCGSELLLEGCYRVTRPIGQGGFAKTFEVSDRGKLKILKVLTLNQTKVVSLFQQEAEVLKRLNHPGIPNAEEYFKFFPQNSQEPVHCLVMDKIEGENLHEWLEKRGNRPISQKQAILWLTQLANILHEVHQQQFFHRDIKPSNIMLTADGQLVLIDFGIAREITGTYEKKQAAGQITKFVSDGYAPLEQITGHAVPQSDFFALGRTFVHLLTGKYPLELMDDPYGDPYTAGLNWRDEANHISSLLADFIDHLMMRRVKDRPANIQVILESLAGISETLYPAKLTQSKSSKPPSTVKAQIISLERTLGSWNSGHSKAVLALAISPDGQTLVSGSEDNIIKVWNLNNGNEIFTLTGHSKQINSVAISPDGQTLVSGSDDDTIKILNLKTGEEISTIKANSRTVLSVAISPDQQMVVSGSSDSRVRLWNLKTGECIKTLATHAYRVSSVAISQDGYTVASSSWDKTIKIWPKSTLTGHLKPVTSIVIGLNSQILVSASVDRRIIVWNLNTGEKIYTLDGHSDVVNSVAISPDSQKIVSGSDDEKIKVWNLSNGQEAYTVNGHLDGVNALVFSPDGQILVSGGKDTTIKVWRMH
ncbi:MULTISPECIES: serine/threonine-protein kinase [unclassified Nostoc]|uniref:serine/threonine-protein kinase n=1 Tax=unclassified Nostoc TaxID=2593658 RepID=UPI002AD57DD5|nr:serine/threonine-protein kinase [Nostoc sp. DedQUE03]MDZ7971048.1 serine/threonine-protein kinase [Nostoc sp. DedQUE03]MDZ8046523.1 serine/threonine-protein kinase [Nostoc sp. DedQUE02]